MLLTGYFYKRFSTEKVNARKEVTWFDDRSKGLKLEAWRQEEARWNDLFARLQQIVER